MKLAKVAGIVAGAAALGGVISAGSQLTPMPSKPPTYAATVTNCRVVGDTLRCGSERIRLLGIDAHELPGHCAIGRDCAPGDPYESSLSLGEAMGDGFSLAIERVGTDRYGRTLAVVRAKKATSPVGS